MSCFCFNIKKHNSKVKQKNKRMSFPINDDCMLLICDYLDLKDIFTLAFVSKEFRNFVKRLFERRSTLVGDYWRKEENQFHIPKIMEYFWKIYGEGCCYDFELLKNKAALERIEFKTVKELIVKSSIELNRNTNEADEIEEIIVNSFPNLKTLELKRRFTGKFLAKVNHSLEIIFFDQPPSDELLETLTSEKLKFAQSVGFAVICQPPTCLLNPKNIVWEKELGFASDQPFMFMDYPHANKHFIRIPVAILRLHGYHDGIFSVRVWLKSIRRLVFNHQFGTIEKFNEIYSKHFSELREFYYLNAPDKRHQKKLLNLIYECRDLKIFDISGSVFEMDFLKSVIKIFEFEKGRSDLNLCCYNTKITNGDLQFLRLPKNLKVTFEKGEPSSINGCRCLSFEVPEFL